MSSRCAAVLAVAFAATSAACVVAPPSAPAAASPAASPAAEWVSGPADLRKVTAVVRVAPPAKMRAQMERLAARSDDPDMGDFLHARAAGGFGSGFLVVHKSARGTSPFLVTNRHVIAGAESAEVTFGDGTTYKDCAIVYANPKADLAVLALPDSAIRTFGHGLAPARSSAHERLTVVATGYPAFGNEPSFQMTEGKISNASFSQPALGMGEALVQHTAPIDPGSSGGPLTNEAGELVGANVAVGRGRSSMFFAVPAAEVGDSVRHAHELVERRKDAAWLTRELGAACTALAAELASRESDFARVDSFVSNELVSDQGWVSYAFAASRPGNVGAAIREGFYRDPVAAMRRAIVLRVFLRADGAGGATGKCGAMNPSDAASIADGKPVRLSLATANGEMELRWTFDQGAWRVAGGDLVDVGAILQREIEDAEAARAASRGSKPSKSSKRAKGHK